MGHKSLSELVRLVSQRIHDDQGGVADIKMYVELAVMMLTQSEPLVLTRTTNVDPDEIWRLVVPVACTVLKEQGVLNSDNAKYLRNHLRLR